MSKDPEQIPPLESAAEKESSSSPTDNDTMSITEQTNEQSNTPPLIPEQDMEVHYHPHLPHGEKKLSAYFKEFMMIFLAVTMGFLAENIREHFAESHKENGYINGFYMGLKNDTASINSTIIYNNTKIKGLDSLIALKSRDMNNLQNREAFYYLTSKYLANYLIFKANDITMQQLRYAGDLRIIRKDHAADSLVSYDIFSTSVQQQGQTTVDMFMEISNLLEQTIDYAQWVNHDSAPGKMSFPIRDQQKLEWLFNKIILYRAVLDFYTNAQLPENGSEAKKLLSALSKRYDLVDGESK